MAATSAPDVTTTPPSPEGEGALAARIGELFGRGMQAGDEAALTEAFREMRAVARPAEVPLVDRVERLARDMRAAGEHGSVVSLICDSGERYGDTYYSDEWVAAQGWDLAPWLAELEAALPRP